MYLLLFTLLTIVYAEYDKDYRYRDCSLECNNIFKHSIRLHCSAKFYYLNIKECFDNCYHRKEYGILCHILCVNDYKKSKQYCINFHKTLQNQCYENCIN